MDSYLEESPVIGWAVSGFAAASQTGFVVLLVLAQQRQDELSFVRELAWRVPCAHPNLILAEGTSTGGFQLPCAPWLRRPAPWPIKRLESQCKVCASTTLRP